MKAKFFFYYLFSFVLVIMIIFLVNGFFFKNNFYDERVLYDLQEPEIFEEILSHISYDPGKGAMISAEGEAMLEQHEAGVQILNGENESILVQNSPDSALSSYSNRQLVDLYAAEDHTVFLRESRRNGENLTVLLYLNPDKVRRRVLSYDVDAVQRAHSFDTLLIVNLNILLFLSLIYSLKIIKPLKNVMDRIHGLSRGEYQSSVKNKGLYQEIFEKLDTLGKSLQAAEEKQESLNEMREEWVTNISHDIKTPLTAIMGNAEILGDPRYSVEEDVRIGYCEKIVKQSQYIETLVDDLNLSSKLQNPSLALKVEAVNLTSLLRHVVIDLLNQRTIHEENLKFYYEQESIFLEGDAHLLQRLFINIIDNAFSHNDSSVKVAVRIMKPSSDKVLITIEDNGKGVLEPGLTKIFHRYYRGTHTGQSTKSSGLGLSIAHDVVQAHQGKITPVNLVKGGFEMRVELPLKEGGV